MKSIELKDCLLILGIILLFIGLYLVYTPAAFVALGGFFMYMGWPEGGKGS